MANVVYTLKCLGREIAEEDLPKAPMDAGIVWFNLAIAKAQGIEITDEFRQETMCRVVHLTLRQLDAALTFQAVADEADRSYDAVLAIFNAIERARPEIFRPYRQAGL